MEYVLLTATRGAVSRLRLILYRLYGMKMGMRNRIEGGGRVRRCSQIELGSYNAFTQGAWLWPEDVDYGGIRIRIGNRNYFNRNVMINACGLIEIGDQNMFGPDVYITDSNHHYGADLAPNEQPMDAGTVKIGNRCWIGAKAVILKEVELGDGCVGGAGAVVTKSVAPGAVVAGVPATLLLAPSGNTEVAYPLQVDSFLAPFATALEQESECDVIGVQESHLTPINVGRVRPSEIRCINEGEIQDPLPDVDPAGSQTR